MVDVPILKIDDPMAEKAVATGKRIGVVCTASTTLVPSEGIIREHAARQGKEVEVTMKLDSNALDAIMAGDRAEHDRRVREAAARLSKENDVVVLAQASMARLAPELNKVLSVPVLASPELCVNSLQRLVED